MKLCPKCRDNVSDQTTVCRVCGHSFSIFGFHRIAMILGLGAVVAVSLASLIDSLPTRDPPPPPPLVAPISTRNSFAENFPALASHVRAARFSKMIARSGEACTAVKKSFYLGSRDGLAYWNVRCEGSGDWMVQLKNDATMTRVACDSHAEVKARCWKPFS